MSEADDAVKEAIEKAYESGRRSVFQNLDCAPFVQVSATRHQTYALDGAGQIWIYQTAGQKGWHKLEMKRW
jgi:hypothetical protein